MGPRRSGCACRPTTRPGPGSGRRATADDLGQRVSGLPEAADAAGILDQLGDDIDLILDGGPAHGGPASTVVDCTGERPEILRVGAVPPGEVAAILDAAGVAHDLD